MAFQGNLRDFSVTEVLQMLGTQKKTGCLMIESGGARAMFYVLEGRLVSTRESGLSPEDPLLRFLIKAHRLSNEQYRGILTIQSESNRDLEDLLVNGRYIEAEELGAYIERQMLDDLMRIMTWADGNYKFDAFARWPHPPLARLSVEGALIEVARRVDEQRRFAELKRDPLQILGVRDLPDAEEQLSEEECELFGVIDGKHTVSEIVEAAPLSEYEAYESLHRMLESNWIEVVGRRDVAVVETASAGVAIAEATSEADDEDDSAAWIGREVLVGAAAIVLALALAWTGRGFAPAKVAPASTDVFQQAGLRDVRFAVELYKRERGHYPERLDELVADRWLTREQGRLGGKPLQYRADAERQHYTLEP